MDNVSELRSAGGLILRAIAHNFMTQADVEVQLCDLENGSERFKRVQQWTQLPNIAFSLIRFAGGTISCVITGSAPALDGIEISNMVESLLGVITGNQAAATAPLVNRFLSCGNDLLSEDALAVVPADASVLLEKIAGELGVSIHGLRQILKETAQRMMEVGESGGPPVSLEMLREDGDAVEGREDAESTTGDVNGSDVEVLKDQFDSTFHERLSALASSADVHAPTPNVACNSTRAVGTRVSGYSRSEDAYREAVIFLLDIEECGTGRETVSTALNTLRERRVTAQLVFRMDHTELAMSMAAHMVIYEQVRLPQFVKLRRCLSMCQLTGRYLSEIMPFLLIRFLPLSSTT
jgi:hypothetical protein